MPYNFLAPAPVNALSVFASDPATRQAPAANVLSKLSPDEESAFQKWIRSTGWYKEFRKEYNEEPNLNDSEYDYRAAWKAGIQPERDPYDKNRYHWPSSLPSGEMLKSPTHPTAWKEQFMRQTGQNPDAMGLQSPQDADVYLKSIRSLR